MARPSAPKTLKVMEYFRKNPDAPASVVTRKFNMAISTVYQLRKRALAGEPAAAPAAAPAAEPSNVDTILDSRAKDYGKFIQGAEIMQMMKRIVHTYTEMRDTQLAFDQREALDMIVHKMGRIINGNPDKVDSWRDIAGYATLVADRLEGNAR